MVSLNRIKRDLIGTVFVELLTKIPLYGFEFLLASWLVINQYAEWVALGLLYRTAPYIHLGALSYFNKRYPLVLGKGHGFAAAKIKYHANSVINLITLFLLCLSLVLLILGCISLTVFFVICGILVMQMFTYCQASLRNEGEFFAYAVGLIVFSLTQIGVAYWTVQRYGVLAGVLSTFIAYSLAVIYYTLILNIGYSYSLPKRKNFNRILKLGWAPFLLTISSFVTQVSDRAALICVDDDYKLACYGFFALFFQIGIVMVNSLGKVLGPYVFHLSGRKKLADTLSISINTCYIILALYISMSLFLFFGGDWLIQHYFKKFYGTLLGVYNYATIGVLMSFVFTFYPQLIVAGKEFIIIKINLIYFITSFIIVYFLAIAFPGFFAYSFGSLLLNIFFTVIILNIIEKIVNKKIRTLRYAILFIFLVSLWVDFFYFFHARQV